MPSSDDDAITFEPKPASIVEYGVEALVIPRVETVLDDALSLLHLQLKKTGTVLAKTEMGLDPEDLRGLVAVVDAVSKISREQRQRAEREDEELTHLSDEELEAELANLEEE